MVLAMETAIKCYPPQKAGVNRLVSRVPIIIKAQQAFSKRGNSEDTLKTLHLTGLFEGLW